jgi:hypothetical protein
MILDAIKRSKEAPAGSGSIPSLDTEHYAAPVSQVWQKGWVKFLALLLGVVLVVGSTVFFLAETNESPAVSSESDATLKTAAEGQKAGTSTTPPREDRGKTGVSQLPAIVEGVPVSSGQTKSVMAGGQSANKTRPIVIETDLPSTAVNRPSPQELSSLYAAMNEEAAVSRESGAGVEVGAKTPVTTLGAEANATSAKASEKSEETEETAAVDFADILAEAQRELGVQPLVDSAEPLLETLSQQTKDLIPSLIYSEHNYSPKGRSEVVLNGQSLTERQRVGPFTVVEILPDSVILRWRETQFRVRARNSWINM